MKLTVHLEGKDRSELVAGMKAHLALLEGGAVAAPAAVTTPGKVGRPPKVKAAEEEEESFEDETEATEEEELDLTDAEETEEEETEEEEASSALDEDQIEKLLGAAAKYAKRPGNDRAKTKALVAKHFKVKSVRDIKPADFAKALKLFGATK